MSLQTNQQYCKVSTDSEALLSEDGSQNSSEHLIEKAAFLGSQNRGFRYALQKSAILGAIITCSILAIGGSFAAGRASVGLTECGKRLSPWSPGLEAVEYHHEMWPEDFNAPSKWRGPPSPELDEEWEKISNEDRYIMRMNRHDLSRINKSETVESAWGFNADKHDPDGVKYIFEAIHQLHCVNQIRKFTWPEYYQLVPDEFVNDENWKQLYYRDHIDHCIEMMRQAIMCTSDITPMTGNRVHMNDHSDVHAENYDIAHKMAPDFGTAHVCRDFEKIRQYAEDNAVGKYD